MAYKYSSVAHIEFCYQHGVGYRKQQLAALIYLLGVLRVTREHIVDIFDMDNEVIKPECLKKAWVTLMARRTIMLAYNLYCDWMPDEYPEDCSPSALFDNDKIREFMLQSVMIRYKNEKQV